MAKKTKISRRKPSVDPRPKFFIFSEGRVSEPSYFVQFARQVCEGKVRVEAPRDNESAPITVCDKAVEKRAEIDRELRRRRSESYSERDQVWAVFDRDEHDSFTAAIVKCKDNNISFAHSVPSFEIWILLHLIYTSRPFKSCDEVMREINQHLFGYEKKEKIDYLEQLISKYKIAETNAIRLARENKNTGDECANPSTFVHKLTMELKSAAGV